MPATHAIRNIARSLAVACIAALAFAVSAPAATVHLNDGRVLEGRIDREGDDFIYLIVKVGSIEHTELILKSSIKSIARDEPAAGGDKPAPGAKDPAKSGEPSAEAVRVAFISLGEGGDKDMVGPFVNAGRLKAAVDLLEDDEPDIVVLKIKSGGGYVSEVEPLSDAIHEYIKPKYTVVAWIDSAISAAAMTGLNCENIYFMSKGNFGAATAFGGGPGGARAVEGEFLEQLLYLAELISERGGYNPLIMRAMQIEQELSVDIDSNGVVNWRPDSAGRYLVNPKGKILTFNAQDAMRYKFADGVADNKDQLMRLIVGDHEWIEVGQDADAFAVKTRDETFRAELAISEIFQKMGLAQQVGDFAKMRRYLGDLRAWARRAPVWTDYPPKGGFPPLSDEFFRQAEEEIRKLQQQDAERNRNNRR
ncbi:MAG: hypothetical protein IBJ10_03600 [Phycisphaerales bacterium]|nr:hypothetical protein [Phycisphaerales bacterium]